jgi:hypothetical protein
MRVRQSDASYLPHLVVMLRCSGDRRCTPTTTTLPSPGDLTGDWTIAETAVTDSCDVPIENNLKGPHPVRLFQSGGSVAGCTDRIFSFGQGAAVTTSGFTLSTGELSSGLEHLDYDERLTGTLPATDAGVAVEERWDFMVSHFPPVCTRVATGLMTRNACGRDLDCIAADGCSRCVAGRCIPLLDCRYQPDQ